jgi:hypothetical protein
MGWWYVLVAPLGRPSDIKWLGAIQKVWKWHNLACQLSTPAPWHVHFDEHENPIYDANHWRQRAEHAQAKADQISWDANLKRKLLRAAEEYDRLAQRAEQWRSTEKA